MHQDSWHLAYYNDHKMKTTDRELPMWYALSCLFPEKSTRSVSKLLHTLTGIVSHIRIFCRLCTKFSSSIYYLIPV